MLLIIAKKCIALKWKSDIDVPSGLWLSEVCNCVPLEKITFLNYIKTVPHDMI